MFPKIYFYTSLKVLFWQRLDVKSSMTSSFHSLLDHHLYVPPTLNDSDILAHELYKLVLLQLTALCQTLPVSQGNAEEERRKALLCVHVRPSHPSLQMQEKESPLPTHVPPFMQGFGIQLLFLALKTEKVSIYHRRQKSIYHLDMPNVIQDSGIKSTVQDSEAGQKTPKIVTSHDHLSRTVTITPIQLFD